MLIRGWGWNTGDVVAVQPRTLMVGDTTMNNNNRRSTPSVASLSSHRDLLVGNEEEKELMLSTSNFSEDSLEHVSPASREPRFSFNSLVSLSNRVRAHCASERNPLKITLLFLTGVAIMVLVFVPVFTLHFFSHHSPQNSSNLVCVIYYANCACTINGIWFIFTQNCSDVMNSSVWSNDGSCFNAVLYTGVCMHVLKEWKMCASDTHHTSDDDGVYVYATDIIELEKNASLFKNLIGKLLDE